MADDSYLTQLKAEKDNLDPSFDLTMKLLNSEIERVEKRGRYTEIHYEKKVKMTEKIMIPVNQYPKYNFVGKLLGPGGTTLKTLQTETGTKMSILGKGSMKDKKKEEELRREGDAKNQHLNENLHLYVEVFSTPADCHSRLAHAVSELQKFMVPDNEGDDLRQQQMVELQYLNGEPVPPPHHGQPGSRPLLSRGRAPPPGGRGRSAPPSHHAPSPGAPPSRGRAAPLRGRGAPRARGVPSRGAMSVGLGRAARPSPARPPPAGQAYARPAPPPVYQEEDAYSTAYEDPAYESYGAESYDAAGYGGAGSETQFYDYGHGSGGRESYDEGYPAETSHASSYGQNGYKQSAPRPSSRPSSRGGPRAHPYASSGRGARY